MKIHTNKLSALILILIAIGFAQSATAQEDESSVIRTFTPSKLLNQGQWDIKWFNNLYTQTESTFSDGTEPRQTFFTSSFDAFTGISPTSKINVGLLFEVRSNVVADRDAFDVFSFDGDESTARSGLTSFAPAVKFNPLKDVTNFTIQSAFHIPILDEESNEEGVFLDQNGFIWQNRFFWDKQLGNGDWQIFTDFTAEYNFGEEQDFTTLEGSFANNSLNLIPGVFLSYFPSDNFTLLGSAQHNQRLDLGNDFSQDFTALGGGAKYQISKTINVEGLYTNFVRGENTGLGETFNIGLRALF